VFSGEEERKDRWGKETQPEKGGTKLRKGGDLSYPLFRGRLPPKKSRQNQSFLKPGGWQKRFDRSGPKVSWKKEVKVRKRKKKRLVPQG